MKIVVLLSGGLDSCVLASHLKAEGHEVTPLAIDYGQRHRVELSHAFYVAAALGMQLERAALADLRHLLGGSSLTDDTLAVPEGHYTHPSMAATVVPNRNMIMISLAAGYAASVKASAVAVAVHAGDHPIYADCRPEFIAALAPALHLSCGVDLRAPFARMSKADIVNLGHELGAPMRLTWSCYKGRGSHCGKCGTCVERREAFDLAGVADPTTYT